jgi:hypothetical protein
MQRMFFKIFLIAVLVALPAYGQSLGDIARENQEKKAADDSSATPPKVITNKVITNKDLPKDSNASLGPSPALPVQTRSQTSDARPQLLTADQRQGEQHGTDQWKRQILAQKNKVATMQARIDLLNASIKNAYGSVQYDAPYNRYQSRQLERAALMQQQLDEQKARLTQMQEAARHAGMHTVVYDP